MGVKANSFFSQLEFAHPSSAFSWIRMHFKVVCSKHLGEGAIDLLWMNPRLT